MPLSQSEDGVIFGPVLGSCHQTSLSQGLHISGGGMASCGQGEAEIRSTDHTQEGHKESGCRSHALLHVGILLKSATNLSQIIPCFSLHKNNI